MSEVPEGYCTLYRAPEYLCVPANSPPGGPAALNFLGLDNYKGDCRQDTQPIPTPKGRSAINSYMSMGTKAAFSIP